MTERAILPRPGTHFSMFANPGRRIRRWLLAAFLLIGLAATGFYFIAAPVGELDFVMLTWKRADTATTMTVLYQTGDDPGVSRVHYDTRSLQPGLSGYRFTADGTGTRFEARERTLHSVELTGLKPATRYWFVVADRNGVRGAEYSFTTLPDDDSPIRLVTGGDMDTTRVAARISRQAARLDPDLAIVGGDIAYAEGKLRKARKWDRWMRDWCSTMVTGDGRLIPFIAAIGNHDVRHGSAGEPDLERSPFFLRYLGQDGSQPSYFSRNLGGLAGLVVLDTDHLRPSEGKQQSWLKDALSAYSNRRYRLAVYHQPLYPGGIYPGVATGENTRLIEAWGAIFDRYGLTLGLENHYHVHKRTRRLKGNRVVTGAGTVYLGGGAWGTEPREVDTGLWYLASAASRNHFWVIDVSPERLEFRALDQNGEVFDQGVLTPDPVPRPAAVPDQPSNSGDRKFPAASGRLRESGTRG